MLSDDEAGVWEIICQVSEQLIYLYYLPQKRNGNETKEERGPLGTIEGGSGYSSGGCGKWFYYEWSSAINTIVIHAAKTIIRISINNIKWFLFYN